MSKFRVKEKVCCLGESQGDYFTGVITDYSWAKKQMETRFMEHLHKYKSAQSKVTMGRMFCKLMIDNKDFIEVSIEEVKGGDNDEQSKPNPHVGNRFSS